MKIGYLKARIIELIIGLFICICLLIASIFYHLEFSNDLFNPFLLVFVVETVIWLCYAIYILKLKKDCMNKIYVGEIVYISLIFKNFSGNYLYCVIKFVDKSNNEHIYEAEPMSINVFFLNKRKLDYLIGNKIKFSYSKTDNNKVYVREINL